MISQQRLGWLLMLAGISLYAAGLIPNWKHLLGVYDHCGYDAKCSLPLLFAGFLLHDIGRGILVILTATALPLLYHLSVAGLAPEKSGPCRLKHLLIATSLGQGFGGGPCFCLVYGALSAFSQTDSSPPSLPARRNAHIALLLNLLACALFVATAVWPPASRHWRTVNLIFQIYPLLYIPLFFLPRRASASSSEAFTVTFAQRKIARLSASLHFLGLAYILKALFIDRIPLLRAGSGVWFILIDTVAFALAACSFIALDAIKGGMPMPVDAIVANVASGGPGYALAHYFGERSAVEARAIAGSPRLLKAKEL